MSELVEKAPLKGGFWVRTDTQGWFGAKAGCGLQQQSTVFFFFLNKFIKKPWVKWKVWSSKKKQKTKQSKQNTFHWKHVNMNTRFWHHCCYYFRYYLHTYIPHVSVIMWIGMKVHRGHVAGVEPCQGERQAGVGGWGIGHRVLERRRQVRIWLYSEKQNLHFNRITPAAVLRL